MYTTPTHQSLVTSSHDWVQCVHTATPPNMFICNDTWLRVDGMWAELSTCDVEDARSLWTELETAL